VGRHKVLRTNDALPRGARAVKPTTVIIAMPVGGRAICGRGRSRPAASGARSGLPHDADHLRARLSGGGT